MILLDQSMAHSISRAVLHDGDLIAHTQPHEDRALIDRVTAVRISQTEDQRDAQRAVIACPALPVCSEKLDNELMEKLSAMYMGTPEEESCTTFVKTVEPSVADENGESSTWAATRKPHRRQCVICEENHLFFNVTRLACGHECCRDCLLEIFEAATVDESRYPPKCCQAISPEPENVYLFLTSEVIEKYREKQVEWETKNRTYCSNLQCDKFIPAEHILADQASCQACHTITCTICKNAAHKLDCPEDEDLQRTLELSLGKGRRRCNSCWSIIDLKHVCNHITLVFLLRSGKNLANRSRCPCKAEFCYACGAKWKTCKCPLWEENRLVLQANGAAGRGRGRGGIGNAVARLQGRAGCIHGRFYRQDEAGACEDCGDYMSEFIFECQNCPLRLCLRCRRTRV